MELISVKALAKKWGLNPAEVYSLIRRVGDPLPAYKIGAIRICPSEAEEWLSRQRI